MVRLIKHSKAVFAAEVAHAGQELTENEKKLLARLVRKYGAPAVRAVVDKTGPSAPRGRPSRGRLPDYEAMHLADWIDEAIEEHRQKGSPTPVKDAENELYEMTVRSREPGDEISFEAWRKNTENKRLAGRRNLAALKKALNDYRQAGRKAPSDT